MNGEAIRSFLVSLGFSVDGTGEKKMSDSMANMEKKAKLLNTAMIAMATATVLAVAKTAGEMEKLYYSTQRIGASAENIRGFEAAVAQMGGSAAGALQSLESVARKIRESPGYEGMIKGLGVATRDQNGGIRDRVAMMGDLAKKLQGMEYHKANAYASSLGIDESTLMAMRDGKFTDNMSKYAEIRKQMGLTDDLAESGKDFSVEARDITMTLKALMEVIIMTAGKALIPVLKMINTFLQAAIKWFSGLNPQVKEFLAAGLKIGTLVVVFGGMFAILAKLALVLPILKGLVFLIRALSLAFLMSPIGIILALAAAIALLWEDYQVWKSGGDSLIDWGKWEPAITLATDAIKGLISLFGDLIAKASEWAKVNIAPHIPEPIKDLHQSAVDYVSETVLPFLLGDPANPVAANRRMAKPRKGWNAAVEAVNGALGVGGGSITDIVEAGSGFNVTKLSDGSTVKRTGARNWRNNNPGNIEYGDFARRHGAIGSDGRFAIFPTYEMGRAAKAALVFEGRNYRGLNLEQAISRYAPPSENDTRMYQNSVLAAVSGVNKTMSSYTQDERMKILDAMERVEGFKAGKTEVMNRPQRLKLPTNSADLAKWADGQVAPPAGNPHREQTNAAPTGGNVTSKAVTISQKTDIHVTGVTDPVLAAQAAARSQEGVNYQLAQNAQSAIT